MALKSLAVLAVAVLIGFGVRISDRAASCLEEEARSGNNPVTGIASIASAEALGVGAPVADRDEEWSADADVGDGVMAYGATQGSSDVWTAAGVCAPAEVDTLMLRTAFDPSMVGSLGEDGPQLDVRESPDRLTIGDYVVVLDRSTETISVSGPDGAEVLERDIRQCVGPADSSALRRAGTWQRDGATDRWRYVDGAVEPVKLAPSAGTS